MNEELIEQAEAVETEIDPQEVVEAMTEKKSQVFDPRNVNEGLIEYDYKCGDCGSYNLISIEEEAENGTIIIRKNCGDCGSTNIIHGYCDAVIECSRCGGTTIVDHPGFKNVRGGINIPPLYTTNKHILGLACKHCANDAGVATSLTLRLIPAENPPAEVKAEETETAPVAKLEVVRD